MAPEWQAFLSGVVGMGTLLVLAIWDLTRTRRDRGNWDQGNWDHGSANPVPKPSGDAPARPLPACLRPHAAGAAGCPSYAAFKAPGVGLERDRLRLA